MRFVTAAAFALLVLSGPVLAGASSSNFGNPALTLGNATFGTITSMQSAEGAGPRNLQFTGRITF